MIFNLKQLSDPYTNAVHKLIVEAFAKVIPTYYKLALKMDLNAGPEFNSLLENFMVHLKDDFFGGNEKFVILFVFIMHK